MWRHMLIQILLTMVYLVQAKENFRDNPICKESMCLTWKQKDEMVILTCKVEMLESKVVFVDPTGQEQAFCVPPTETTHCIPHYYNTDIKQNLLTNETTFTFPTKRKGIVDGNWKSIHGNLETEVMISLVNGTISSTDIKFDGRISHSNESILEMTVYCFSCWEPVGNSVEFFVDNVSMDSIRYSNGTCYHRRQACTPDKCSCYPDANLFSWTYIENRKQNINYNSSFKTYISCEMRFEDVSKHTSYKKYSTLLFTETVAIQIGNYTEVITSPAHANDDEIKHDTDSRDNNDVLIISAAVILTVLFLCIFIWRLYRCVTKDKSNFTITSEYEFCKKLNGNDNLFDNIKGGDAKLHTGSGTRPLQNGRVTSSDKDNWHQNKSIKHGKREKKCILS